MPAQPAPRQMLGFRRASSWQEGAGSFLASGLCLLPAALAWCNPPSTAGLLSQVFLPRQEDSCSSFSREALVSGPLCPVHFPQACVFYTTPWGPQLTGRPLAPTFGGHQDFRWVWHSGLCLTSNLKVGFLFPSFQNLARLP